MVNFGGGDVPTAGGTQAGTGAVGTTTAAAAAADAGAGVSQAGGYIPEEAKSLDSLYADARHEGGKFVIYAGVTPQISRMPQSTLRGIHSA